MSLNGIPNFVDKGAIRIVPLGGDMAVHFYADGTATFAHRCDRGDRGVILCSPLLQLHNGGHRIVTADPLTVSPSILCGDCGTHGFVTDGVWMGC